MVAKLIFEQELIDKIVEMLFERIKPILASCGNTKPDDIIFDVKALCEYLAVSEQWVYKQVHEKGILHLKIRGLLRFRKKSIDT
jgi:excisionase family DNA binding protein